MPGMRDAAKPLSRYAPFRRDGDLVIFAGITAVDPDRAIVIRGYADMRPELRSQVGETGEMSTDPKDGPITAQSWFVLGRLRNAVTVAGGPLDDVVKLTQYFFNLRDFPIYNELHAKFFRNPPASTVVGVADPLPTPDVLLEVEAIAHLPEERR
jgi:enamine deaminase RidA (YjgF/YER057c/UK114 family)